MCLFPINAVKYSFFQNGEKVSFCKPCKDFDKFYNNNKNVYDEIIQLSLKCGKCFECCKEYSNEWAFRCYCESLLHEENCFITLTYEGKNPELSKRDLQLFLKRLRKSLQPVKIRYFACGEYGSKHKRPHYHLILFGYSPPDKEKFFISKKGEQIFKSAFLSGVWQKGFVSVGDLTIESAKYCCKYLQKLQSKHDKFLKACDFFGLQKPFVLMSCKPGIGADYFKNNLDLLDTDKIYSNSGYIKIPRYFLDIAENKFGLCLDDLKSNRYLKSVVFQRSELDLKKKRKILSFRLNAFKK